MDWWKLISEYLPLGAISDDDTEIDVWRDGVRGTSSMTMSCIIATPQVPFSSAFLSKRVRLYFLIFTRGFVGIMLHQKAWSKKLSNKVSTSRWLPTTRLRS
jgi:hypothetical protein